MNETQEPKETYPRRDQFEDETELIDYLRVIWKWKWLIILGTFVCMVVAGVMSLRMPKIYEVSATIEPGIIGMDQDGGFIYVDSQDNIAEKIKGGTYNNRIIKDLNLNPLEIGVTFEVKQPGQTKLIKIISEWEEDSINIGLKTSRSLISLLSQDYKNIVDQRIGDYTKRILMKKNQIKGIETQRKDIDKQILMKKNQIKGIETQRKDIDKQILMKKNKIEEIKIQRKDIDKKILLTFSKIEEKRNNIKLNNATLMIIQERQKQLLQEIKDTKNNTGKIVQERNNVLKQKSNVDDISLLLYSTTIQQNLAYFNQLSDQVNELKKQEMQFKADINKFKKEIDDINTEIDRLKIQKTEGLQAKIDDINTEIDRLKIQKTEGLQAKIDDINTEIDRLKIQKTEGLQAKIDDINAEIEMLELKKTEGLQAEIDDIKIQIDRISLEKSTISNVKFIQQPEVSPWPVRPKKKRNVLLAGVVAFMMMMFLAFFWEYIQKTKHNNLTK